MGCCSRLSPTAFHFLFSNLDGGCGWRCLRCSTVQSYTPPQDILSTYSSEFSCGPYSQSTIASRASMNCSVKEPGRGRRGQLVLQPHLFFWLHCSSAATMCSREDCWFAT